MRSADFRTLLDRCPADVALFSTYAFQPTYFERSLLNSRALANARRIVVLMDGSQYHQLQRDVEPTQHLNHRYLLVPVFRKAGVFHPKLHLLASSTRAMVFCGSCNLTQPGCTHNLEMLNAIQIEVEEGQRAPATVSLAQQTLAFFEEAIGDSDSRAAKLATDWLEDLKEEVAWLRSTTRQRKVDGALRLVHSLGGAIWPQIRERIGDGAVERVTALSPFYDRELAVVKMMRDAWPDCEIRIVAQQHTSNLPTQMFRAFAPRPELFALTEHQERRLHAKVLTIETANRTYIVAGSANFTRQAWDGTNVEACLVWDTDEEVESGLFDEALRLQRIAPENFASGTEGPPAPDPQAEGGRLYLSEAVLESAGRIRIDYGMDSALLGGEVTLRLYPAGRLDPLAAACLVYALRCVCCCAPAPSQQVPNQDRRGEILVGQATVPACYRAYAAEL